MKEEEEKSMREAKIKKSSAEEFIDLLRQVCDQFPLQFASFGDEQKTIPPESLTREKEEGE